MLKHVLKATVRGSGQGSHTRLIYGLTSTKKQSASAHDTAIVTDHGSARQHRDPISPRRGWPSGHDDLSVSGPRVKARDLAIGEDGVVFGRSVGAVEGVGVMRAGARPYLGPRSGRAAGR
jgi:hypothetical protein